MSTNEILFVDDDQQFLSSIYRNLKRKLPIVCIASVSAALDELERKQYSVVVSDMKMPEMNGVDFLSLVKKKYPDSVRILFTGFAGQETAVDAVNRGEIFRFLTKPCDIDLLTKILGDALRQYQLIMAEKDILEKTVLRTIRTLSQLLSLVNPVAEQRANRLRGYSQYLASAMGSSELWFFEVVALLSQIGCANIAQDDLVRYYTIFNEEERTQSMFEDHAAIAEELLSQIPRLEEVAKAISMQNMPYDKYDSIEERCNPVTEQAAQILHIALALDSLSFYRHLPFDSIVDFLKGNSHFNQEIVERLSRDIELGDECVKSDVLFVKDLRIGMILAEEIRSNSGLLLANVGQELTDFLLIGIRKYSQKNGVNEPVSVRIPTKISHNH